ncbi:unnamed protein product [Parnassius apollo]|uniref:(apollo) hypothetical protein n=1 Tax=Parnassius apollo TaxID=110799 RepID=A0A8S3Y3I9_PARAO|nr:unnamed protein product [Parnassius apollo]
MSNNSKPTKRSSEPSTSRVARRKRLNSSEVEELLRDSDEDVYAGSDVDDLENIADEGDASSESAADEEEEENVEAVPEQRFDASSDQTSSSPPTDLQQPFRTASTTRWTTDSSSMRDISFTKTYELLVPPPGSPRGTMDETSGPGHTEKIVEKLLQNNLDSGHAVFMDNFGIVVLKPLAVLQYNQNMSVVDLQDQMLSYVNSRWYVKIFIHVIMMSMLNARQLYNKFSGKPSLSLYDFREKVIESFLPERQVEPQVSQQSKKNRLTKIEKSKEIFSVLVEKLL